MIYFTSDTHFFHKRILEFTESRRHWAPDLEQMNQALITFWNKRVGIDDMVYHLGDVGLNCDEKQLQKILWELNGDIVLIRGNHDRSERVDNLPFDSIEMMMEIKWHRYHITLCHYPLASWNHDKTGGWMLHGHCHGNYSPSSNPLNHDGKILDVGVDGPLGPGPISIEEIEKYMRTRLARTKGEF